MDWLRELAKLLPRQLSQEPITGDAALGKNKQLDTPRRSLSCEPANRIKIGRLVALDRLKLYRRGLDVIHADIVTRFRLRLPGQAVPRPNSPVIGCCTSIYKTDTL